MTIYNNLNVKLSNLQLNKLMPAIKNETEVVLRLSSNMINDNETNLPHKLLLTNRQVARARSLVVSDLRSETKGSRFESGCQLCAEVSSLQQSPG